MEAAYVAPLTAMVVAIIGAVATYLTRRDERADALKELELMERLHALPGTTREFELASQVLTRRLERWESREREALFSQANAMVLGGAFVLLVLQSASHEISLSPDGSADGWRLILNAAVIIAMGVAGLGLFSMILQAGGIVVIAARGLYRAGLARRAKSQAQESDTADGGEFVSTDREQSNDPAIEPEAVPPRSG